MAKPDQQTKPSRRSRGLCADCKDPPVDGQVRCQECTAKQERRYAERVSRGLCGQCGEKAVPRSTLCPVHQRQDRYFSRRQQKRRDEGDLCLRCESPAEQGKSHCTRHSHKSNQKANETLCQESGCQDVVEKSHSRCGPHLAHHRVVQSRRHATSRVIVVHGLSPIEESRWYKGRKIGDYWSSEECIWCGLAFSGERDSLLSKTREHLIPKMFVCRGTPGMGITASHLHCNFLRATYRNWLPYWAEVSAMPVIQLLAIIRAYIESKQRIPPHIKAVVNGRLSETDGFVEYK